jgi:hypothetical protein
MCAQGSKMVILVTGICSASCFYCPLSFRKAGKDRIFADEWELESEDDTEKIILEAEYIDASGAGITGGDPLLVVDRVCKYVTLLKEVFGSSFHIHLYTAGLSKPHVIQQLASAGLDEIRFHPMPNHWSHMEKSPLQKVIQTALDTSLDVAIEIPVFPNKEQEILSLIEWADTQSIRWVNLNELEFSERNCIQLNKRGYKQKNDISAAVLWSETTALTVLHTIRERDMHIGVHYCSVSFKDGVQLTNRIKRRATNVAKQHEVITYEGLLYKGAVSSSTSSLKEIYSFLKETYAIPEHYLWVDTEKKRIEIAPWILESLSPSLLKKGYTCYYSEEYPTADRLEVEKIPLVS